MNAINHFFLYSVQLTLKPRTTSLHRIYIAYCLGLEPPPTGIGIRTEKVLPTRNSSGRQIATQIASISLSCD